MFVREGCQVNKRRLTAQLFILFFSLILTFIKFIIIIIIIIGQIKFWFVIFIRAEKDVARYSVLLQSLKCIQSYFYA